MHHFLRQQHGQKVRDYFKYIHQQLMNGNHAGCSSTGYCNENYRDCAEQWLVEGFLPSIYEELCSALQEHSQVNLRIEDILEEVQDGEWLWTMRLRSTNYFGRKAYRNNRQGFRVDNRGHVIVYTDGACRRNGHPGAQGGIGVWFGPNNRWNTSAALDSCYRQSNTTAEIRAAIEAIEIIKNLGFERVAIHTDSEFLYYSMTDYIFYWLESGWYKRNGQSVVNFEDFQALLKVMEDIDVEWVHVNAHEPLGTSRHSLGNNEADRLAREAIEF